MAYWDDQKKTLQKPNMASSVKIRRSVLSSPDYSLDAGLLPITKLALAQKLDQKLLLTLMKLRSHLLNFDLPFLS